MYSSAPAIRSTVNIQSKSSKDAHARAIVAKFYTMAAMIGVNEEEDHTFRMAFQKGVRTFRSKSQGDEKLFLMLGGRNTALKILRHVSMVALFFSQQENEHAFGTIDQSFLDLVELYPVLRSFYEQAKHGVSFHTWH